MLEYKYSTNENLCEKSLSAAGRPDEQNARGLVEAQRFE